MIDSIEFVSVDEAEIFVPDRPSVAISILSPGRAPARLDPGFVAVLREAFLDSLPADRASPESGQFSPEHAQRIVAFIRAWHDREEHYRLLIHCEAGISRSAAVAVFAASECRVALSGYFAFLNPWVLNTLVRTAYPHYAFCL